MVPRSSFPASRAVQPKLLAAATRTTFPAAHSTCAEILNASNSPR
jgi:hypothetical protein